MVANQQAQICIERGLARGLPSGIKKGSNINEHSKRILHHKNFVFEQEGNGGKMGSSTTFPPTCIFRNSNNVKFNEDVGSRKFKT